MSNAENPGREPAPTSQESPAGGRRLAATVFAIVAIVLVGGVSAWAAYVWITGKDGFNWRRFTLRDANRELVKYDGQILFNGEPLTSGHVQTYPVAEDGPPGAIGVLDEQGRFTLDTHVKGHLTSGAYVGEYKLVVEARYPAVAGRLAPAEKMLSDEYYDPEKTPLRLTVSADPEQNHHVFRLTGELRKPPPSGRPGGKKQPRDPAAIIRRIMENDADGDKKISKDEAPQRLKDSFDRMDADGDGFLDEQELKDAFSRRSGRGKRAGGKQPPAGQPAKAAKTKQ